MPKVPGKNLGVCGPSGRMGQEVLRLAEKSGAWKSITPISQAWSESPKQIDIVIDFSSPAGLMSAMDWCVKNRKPLVSGTTGLRESEKKKLAAAGRKIPVLWSANMSLGVHILAQALHSLKSIADWSFQIEETHHVMKKDKPSGTALFLHDGLETIIGKTVPEPISYREGDVIGIHRVSATSPEEMLVFEHKALSRSVFAKGALVAAEWLLKRRGKAKLYRMSDVLRKV